METGNKRWTQKSFDDLIRNSEKPVLVDFWAAWCGPCKMVSPVIERIAKDYSGRMTTVKVNVDKKPHIAVQYRIESIPTIMMFWRGGPIMRVAGAQSQAQLQRHIDDALSDI
ncbi:MAG: thioredoxin [Gemmatimonadota bacterium]|nr:MAG: thioredoxin [Gemmatimonadota bacterium]